MDSTITGIVVGIESCCAYSQVHYPRGSLPNPPLAIHPRTEAIPQEGVYKTIPGESQPLPRDSAYVLMNIREGSLPHTTTESQPELTNDLFLSQ